MFENFKWDGLDKLPLSLYRSYSYDVKISEGFDKDRFMKEFAENLKNCGFSLNMIQRKYVDLVNGNVSVDGPLDTYVIKKNIADDMTYLNYDLKILSGQAKPNDMDIIANALKSCSDVISVVKTKDKEVFRLSDKEYNDFIFRNAKIISEAVIVDAGITFSNDRFKAKSQIDDIAIIFTHEAAIPREGNVIPERRFDMCLLESTRNMLTMSYNLGYYQEFVWDKINKQTVRLNEERAKIANEAKKSKGNSSKGVEK